MSERLQRETLGFCMNCGDPLVPRDLELAVVQLRKTILNQLRSVGWTPGWRTADNLARTILSGIEDYGREEPPPNSDP